MLPSKYSDAYRHRFAAAATLGHTEWLLDDERSVEDLVIAVGEALQNPQQQVDAVTPPRW